MCSDAILRDDSGRPRRGKAAIARIAINTLVHATIIIQVVIEADVRDRSHLQRVDCITWPIDTNPTFRRNSLVIKIDSHLVLNRFLIAKMFVRLFDQKSLVIALYW